MGAGGRRAGQNNRGCRPPSVMDRPSAGRRRRVGGAGAGQNCRGTPGFGHIMVLCPCFCSSPPPPPTHTHTHCQTEKRLALRQVCSGKMLGFFGEGTHLCFVEGSTRANVLTRSLAPAGRTPTFRNGDESPRCAIFVANHRNRQNDSFEFRRSRAQTTVLLRFWTVDDSTVCHRPPCRIRPARRRISSIRARCST